MTRYFFDFLTGDILLLDEHGAELPNAAAAHTDALNALVDAIQDVVLQGLSDQRVAVNVRDERGPVLQVTAVLNSKVLRRL